MQGNGPILALALILALTLACGSENQGGPGPEDGAGYDRMYDPKTVETVSGEVVSVDKITDRGKGYGVSLTLKTNRGDHPGVPGSRLVPRKTRPLLRAQGSGGDHRLPNHLSRETGLLSPRRCKKGDQSLKLRDPAGIPAWAGADNPRLNHWQMAAARNDRK